MNDSLEMTFNKNRNIFFIDSDGETDVVIKNIRKACNIEAAALLNPDYTIYMIFLTLTSKIFHHQSKLADALSSYKNIKIRFMNIEEFCKGTELESWIKSDPFWKYSTEQIAEVMKILSVYKYGGVFLDFNTLSIRPIHEIDYPNFACSDGRFSIYSGIIKLDKKYGREFIKEFFKRLQKVFNLIPISSDEDESNFIKKSNSPEDPQKIFTDTIRHSCRDSIDNDTTTLICDDFYILPASACAPKLKKNRKKFFMENRSKFVLSKIKKSFFVKIAKDEIVTGKFITNSRSAYGRLARKFCPKIVNAAG